MGQGQSKEISESPGDIILEKFTRKQITEYFTNRCQLLFRPLEIKAITTKLDIKNLKEQTDVSITDLAYVFQIIKCRDENVEDMNENITNVLKIMCDSFKVIGKFPFIQDNIASNDLTIDDLLKTAVFHTGRYKKVISLEFDYLKLLFVSLSNIGKVNDDEKISTEDQKNGEEKEECFEVKVDKSVQLDSINDISQKIRWNTLDSIKTFDNVDLDSLYIEADKILQLFTFYLILSSIPEKGHGQMYEHFAKNISRWKTFENFGLAMIRYMNIDIVGSNIKTSKISYKEFERGITHGMPDVFVFLWSRLFKNSMISSVNLASETRTPESKAPVSNEKENNRLLKKKLPIFKESRLVNEASISLISMCLTNLGSNISVSVQNLVKLFTGSESGFSIRSLEQKIFKWQAPTLLIVSGKRIKQKTIHHNNRYQQFDLEYPQYFRLNENPTKEWQKENDKITYAVIVNQPWKNSNKKNFGDENSIILNLHPRLDFYKSLHSQVLKGELIYFNNLGMGLGFGNEQPINKTSVKKFMPGNISLTIESNLEFSIFRHITTPNSNTSSNFFQKSSQEEVQNQDFEDRFTITDLEVWGIGSTKELEEQRKQWKWEEKQAEARQSVNLKSLGEERAFLEMVGLVGNHGSSGGSV